MYKGLYEAAEKKMFEAMVEKTIAEKEAKKLRKQLKKRDQYIKRFAIVTENNVDISSILYMGLQKIKEEDNYSEKSWITTNEIDEWFSDNFIRHDGHPGQHNFEMLAGWVLNGKPERSGLFYLYVWHKELFKRDNLSTQAKKFFKKHQKIDAEREAERQAAREKEKEKTEEIEELDKTLMQKIKEYFK